MIVLSDYDDVYVIRLWSDVMEASGHRSIFCKRWIDAAADEIVGAGVLSTVVMGAASAESEVIFGELTAYFNACDARFGDRLDAFEPKFDYGFAFQGEAGETSAPEDQSAAKNNDPFD